MTTTVITDRNVVSAKTFEGFKSILIKAQIENCTDTLDYQVEDVVVDLDFHRTLVQPVSFVIHLGLDSCLGFGLRWLVGDLIGSTVAPWRQPSCS